MDTPNPQIEALEKRIEVLEKQVSRLSKARPADHAQSAAGMSPSDGPRPFTRMVINRDPVREQLGRLGALLTGEGAIARIGMALLLVGVAYLVKYGIDRGWIGEMERVLIAASTGAVLIGLGLRLSRRPVLSQILSGGGVGALYIAAFSAHVFYGLISFPVALGLMSAVTVLCLYLSIRQDSHALASIAVTAGLGTPFILSNTDGSLAGLAAYILAIQVASASIFWIRRWGATLVVSAFMTFLALFLAIMMIDSETGLVAKIWLQSAAIGAFIVYGVLGLRRTESHQLIQNLATMIAAIAPIALLIVAIAEWDLDRWGTAALAGIGAAIYGFLWYSDSARDAARGVFRFATVALAAISVFALTDGEGAAIVVVLGALLQYLETRHGEEDATWLSHLLVGLGALILWGRLADAGSGFSYEYTSTLYDGIGVAALVMAARWGMQPRIVGAAAWLGGLLFLRREFGYLGELTDSGPALVTLAWAALAIALLVISRRTREDLYRYAGMATVGLVVLKLVFFDLNDLDPIWRILIFTGIGAALLATSYLFPALWRGDDDLEDVEP